MSTTFLGIAATVIGLAGYVPYFISIFRGETKPHVFSWFVWATLMAIGFVIQVVEGGGPGAWVTGASSAICYVVAAIGCFYGEKNITRSDWATFLSCLAAIPLWYATKDPLWSVFLISLIDILGFYPTFRKSWSKPYEEHSVVYTLSGLKHFISLFALTKFTLTTAVYPLVLVVMNVVFVTMLFIRRRAVPRPAAAHAATPPSPAPYS